MCVSYCFVQAELEHLADALTLLVLLLLKLPLELLRFLVSRPFERSSKLRLAASALLALRSRTVATAARVLHGQEVMSAYKGSGSFTHGSVHVSAWVRPVTSLRAAS